MVKRIGTPGKTGGTPAHGSPFDMLTLFRWLLRLTIGLIVLLVLAAILAWYFAARSLPDYNATLQVQGISAPVEIVRSTENVPHIFGQTDEDVFFALGLAHAPP